MKRIAIAGALALLPMLAAQAAQAADDPLRAHAEVVPLEAPPEDAALQVYLDQALRANPALAARDADVRASDADLAATRAQQYPQVSLNARYTHADGGRTIDLPVGDLLNPVYDTLNRMLEQQGQPAQFPQIDNQHIAFLRAHEQETKLSLSAPLIAPQLWASIDAKRALAGASRAGREAYARMLVRELKRTYYGAVEAAAAAGILEASEKLLAENVRVSQALVDAGKATRDRVLRAEAEHLDASQQLDAARARTAQARRLLNLLRAQPDDAPLLLPVPEALRMPARRQRPPQTRPELRQIDENTLAAQATERAARNAGLPTLGVAADYGIQGTDYRFDDEHDFDTVSLVLSWKLWDAGQRRAEQAQAAAQSDSLRRQRTDLERRLELARRGAEDDLATALRAIDTGVARVAAAAEAFRIAERKRDIASLSQIEFLDAERSLREAKLKLAIARCDALDRAAELELASASYDLPDNLTAP
jgi:outer membrane protein TolC